MTGRARFVHALTCRAAHYPGTPCAQAVHAVELAAGQAGRAQSVHAPTGARAGQDRPDAQDVHAPTSLDAASGPRACAHRAGCPFPVPCVGPCHHALIRARIRPLTSADAPADGIAGRSEGSTDAPPALPTDGRRDPAPTSTDRRADGPQADDPSAAAPFLAAITRAEAAQAAAATVPAPTFRPTSAPWPTGPDARRAYWTTGPGAAPMHWPDRADASPYPADASELHPAGQPEHGPRATDCPDCPDVAGHVRADLRRAYLDARDRAILGDPDAPPAPLVGILPGPDVAPCQLGACPYPTPCPDGCLPTLRSPRARADGPPTSTDADPARNRRPLPDGPGAALAQAAHEAARTGRTVAALAALPTWPTSAARFAEAAEAAAQRARDVADLAHLAAEEEAHTAEEAEEAAHAQDVHAPTGPDAARCVAPRCTCIGPCRVDVARDEAAQARDQATRALAELARLAARDQEAADAVTRRARACTCLTRRWGDPACPVADRAGHTLPGAAPQEAAHVDHADDVADCPACQAQADAQADAQRTREATLAAYLAELADLAADPLSGPRTGPQDGPRPDTPDEAPQDGTPDEAPQDAPQDGPAWADLPVTHHTPDGPGWLAPCTGPTCPLCGPQAKAQREAERQAAQDGPCQHCDGTGCPACDARHQDEPQDGAQAEPTGGPSVSVPVAPWPDPMPEIGADERLALRIERPQDGPVPCACPAGRHAACAVPGCPQPCHRTPATPSGPRILVGTGRLYVAPVGTPAPWDEPEPCPMAPYAPPGPDDAATGNPWTDVGTLTGPITLHQHPFDPGPWWDGPELAPVTPLAAVHAVSVSFDLVDVHPGALRLLLGARPSDLAARATRKRAGRALRLMRRRAAIRATGRPVLTLTRPRPEEPTR